MSILQRLTSVFFGERKASPYQWLVTSGDKRPMWTMDNYASFVRKGFAVNALVYGAIMYKVRAIALTQVRGYTGDEHAPSLLERTHPLARLLARPNRDMSWKEFEGLNTVYLNLAGNGFVYVERSGRTVTGLYPLRPDRVRIIPDSDGQLLGYLYIPYGKGEDNAVPILPEDMLHVKMPNPMDDYEGLGYGMSPMRVLGQSADVDNDLTKHLKILMQNGAMPAGLLKAKVPIDSQQAGEIRARWRERYGGVDNWSDVAVLGDDMEYQRLSMTMNELGFEKVDERNESRLLTVLGVPAILLDTRIAMSNSTYANKAEARKAFWEDTFTYEMSLWDDEYRFVLETEREWVRRDLSHVPALARNVPELVKAAKDLWTMGMPANQALKTVGVNAEAFEGGDESMPMRASTKPALTPNPSPTGGEGDNDDAERILPDEEDDADAEESTGAEKSFLAPSPAPAPSPLPPLPKVEGKEAIDCACGCAERILSVSAETSKSDGWTDEAKALAWKAVDNVALAHEDAFRVAAGDAFAGDMRAILAIVGGAQEKALARKATIVWESILPEVQAYLQQEAGARWQTTFIPAMEAVVRDTAETWSVELGRTWDVTNIRGLQWFQDYTLKFSDPISQTTGEALKSIISQAQLEGWSIYEMQTNLQTVFQQWMAGNVSTEDLAFLQARVDWWRAEMIARTETTRLQNAGSTRLFQEWAIPKKEWLAAFDARTRDTHTAASGQVRLMDEPFSVGGYPMMHPGDSSGGAPPREFVNCRCAVLPLSESGGKP